MEHIYTVHTKLVENKTYYFVKKLMRLTEFKGLADVVVGYGMHTDFEKACKIAGVDDGEARKQLLIDLEKINQPILPDVQAPVQADKLKKNIQKRTVEIPETVNRWLFERGAEVLN
jgi:hypothetical protein